MRKKRPKDERPPKASKSKNPKPKRKKVRRAKGMRPQRQVTVLRTLGLLFAAGGFTAIALGWYGAARVACVDCQIPYLLSGGFAGLALVVFGGILLALAQVRAERMRLYLLLEGRLNGDAGRPVATLSTAPPVPESSRATPRDAPAPKPAGDRAERETAHVSTGIMVPPAAERTAAQTPSSPRRGLLRLFR